MSWAATVLTLYPDMFPGSLGQSLAGRAMAEGKWSLETVQIRDFATDRHRSVDDTPAGGGAGMVMRADILAAAVDHVLERQAEGADAGDDAAGAAAYPTAGA
jgi:tRNA (guanine37-N1)-methyltransferase